MALGLYGLLDQRFKILEKLDNLEDEEEISRLLEELNKIDIAVHEHVENIVRFKKNLDYTAEFAREEAKRLLNYARSCEKKSKRLSQHVVNLLKLSNRNQVTTRIGTVFIRTTHRVVVDDEESIPQQYKTIVWKLKKEELSDDIRQGLIVPGAHIEESIVLGIRRGTNEELVEENET
ncbi:MAG: siphovirus Gp157 family protein [Candidatus Bathyarchaeia archaeon]